MLLQLVQYVKIVIMSRFVFEKVFCEFPSLQILYLHGNAIKDIKEVDKLAKLKSLRKLALHGNSLHTTKVIYII